MLGLGRALGETIAVATVLSRDLDINWHILDPGGNTFAANIALQVRNEAADIGRAALIASGLVLFVITLVVNMAARLIIARRKEFSGANCMTTLTSTSTPTSEPPAPRGARRRPPPPLGPAAVAVAAIAVAFVLSVLTPVDGLASTVVVAAVLFLVVQTGWSFAVEGRRQAVGPPRDHRRLRHASSSPSSRSSPCSARSSSRASR